MLGFADVLCCIDTLANNADIFLKMRFNYEGENYIVEYDIK